MLSMKNRADDLNSSVSVYSFPMIRGPVSISVISANRLNAASSTQTAWIHFPFFIRGHFLSL